MNQGVFSLIAVYFYSYLLQQIKRAYKYIMENLNIKPRMVKMSSFAPSNQQPNITINVNNNSNTRPPFPQSSQHRPASQSHHVQHNQTYSYVPRPTIQNRKVEQNLQSMARKVHEPDTITFNIQEPYVKKGYHKEFQINPKIASNYSSNSIGKYSLNNSIMISNQSSSVKLKQQKYQRSGEKHHSQFLKFPSSELEKQKLIPQLKFSSFSKEKESTPLRLNKTDRDVPQRTFPGSFPNKPKIQTNIASMNPLFEKVRVTELDSTIHTEAPEIKIEKNNFLQIPESNDGFKKNYSPSNIWPLASSPSEQKRQNSFHEPFIAVEIDKKLGHEASTTQFKKKKNFQFFKNLKKKNSNLIKQQNIKQWSIDDFQLLDKIGKGSFGDVYMAQEKATSFLCVIKKLLKKKIKEQKLQEHLMRQIKVQSYLDHRHLTPLYGFFSDEKFIYLIQQYMPDGSLLSVKKKRKIPQSQVSFYVRQMCFGLKYMHTEKIIHRDIKPENIFLNGSYAKIGDFGCSVYTKTLRSTQIGSFAYLSPEQLKMESYDEKIDVWSVGVMTYELLCGVSPFEAEIIQIAKRQKKPQLSQLKFPQNVEISSVAKDFLQKMLDLDPKQRIGIDEALRHEFILKYIRSEDERSL